MRVRVLRGRAESPAADVERTGAMLDRTGETGVPAVRVWTPHRQVAFGRRDARAAGYESARAAAADRGYPAVERHVGGRAVAYTGTTVAVAWTEPVADLREGLQDRYEALTGAIQRALWRCGVPAQRGEPDGAFCPGGHALSCRGKVAGLAQRVRQEAALVGGVVVVDGHGEIGDVLASVYGALDVPFVGDAVGSVARAGGDVAGVRDAVEATIVADADPEYDQV
ncbi:MAG: lipoate--protein ligase family protein [Halobacteriaceae archaeon]